MPNKLLSSIKASNINYIHDLVMIVDSSRKVAKRSTSSVNTPSFISHMALCPCLLKVGRLYTHITFSGAECCRLRSNADCVFPSKAPGCDQTLAGPGNLVL